jgi:hypothetical protein
MKTKEKILTINFTAISKKIHFLLIFAGAVILLPMALGSEDLEVKTYYPFPYVSYDNFTVTDEMTLGSNIFAERIRLGNITQGSRNFQGIESNGDLYLQSVNAINIASNIQLDVPPNNPKRVSILGRFCRWRSWNGHGNQCLGMRGGLKRWQPVILAYQKSGNSYRTYYNSAAENPTRKVSLNFHSSNGRVLCCRIHGR